MAKRKSSKKSNMSLIYAIIVMVFGALLFSAMFMPLYKVDAVVASSTISIADAIGEELGDGAFAAAVWTGFIASLIGAIMVAVALVSLFIKMKLLNQLNLILAIVATALGIACVISTFIFIGDANEYVKVASISAASFVAVGSGIIGTIAAKLKA